MSKLYVPEGVWLVCSEGTSTQQLAVVSQSMAKIDDGHLMATVEDKVKADFGCKKGALFSAIAMAVCAMAVTAFVVGTGGLGACAIIGAAGALDAVGGGHHRQADALRMCLVYGQLAESQPIRYSRRLPRPFGGFHLHLLERRHGQDHVLPRGSRGVCSIGSLKVEHGDCQCRSHRFCGTICLSWRRECNLRIQERFLGCAWGE